MLIPGELKVTGMGTQSNAPPVIIKRKKIVAGDAHHGGAWKVAMTFFLQSESGFAPIP